MTFRSIVFLLLPSLIILAVVAPDLQACSCMKVGPPCQEYWRSEAVFTGAVTSQQVIEVKDGQDKFQQRLVHFTIDQSFKGVSKGEVEIVTGMGGGDCGYHFKTGERYIVYAARYHRDKKQWYAGICNRILPLARAAEDLTYLRALPEAGSGGSVLGRVTRMSLPLEDDGKFVTTYLENIRVTVEGPGGRFEANTDGEGRYRIAGLPPGRYKVRADLPEHLDGYSSGEFEVVDRGCAEADFHVQVDGQISGLVTDDSGKPVRNVKVDLIALEDGRSAAPKGKWRFTTDAGNYKLDWLPPGNYYLGINLIGGQSNRCPYPRTYFPGVAHLSQAAVISLHEGQKLTDQNIIVPSKQPDLELEVEVFWPDGTLADTVEVILHAGGPSFHITGDRASKLRPGVFRIKGFKDCSYWLKAFTYGHPGEPGGGKPWHDEVEIDPSKDLTKPFRLVLSKQGFPCPHHLRN